MALQIKNTKELIKPETFRLNVLVYGLSGVGKTLWASTAPNPGIVACETGHGRGLLTLAASGLDYVTPTTLAEFEEVVNGKVFADKQTLVLDSLTDMVNTFIKDAALAIPRAKGSSPKRERGVPELDDYGVMGELTRKMLRALLTRHSDKHIVVTATERIDKPDPENGQGEQLIGPTLPGAMFLAAPAAFDLVLRLRTRTVMRDPRDAKSKYIERYLLTQPDGQGSIVKSRPNVQCKSTLPKEVVIDYASGSGTFTDVLQRILEGYKEVGKAHVESPVLAV